MSNLQDILILSICSILTYGLILVFKEWLKQNQLFIITLKFMTIYNF